MNKLTLLFVLFCSYQISRADVVVVGNVKNKTTSLTTSEIQDIYLGRSRSFPDGSLVLPIDQANLRGDFYQKLTNRPVEQINAFWARIVFSGQASPPMILADDKAIIKTISENPSAIGYISKENLTNEIRVFQILK